MSRALGVNNIKQYHPLIQTETLQFLRRTLADPDYVSNVKRYAGGMTLLVVYGLEVRSNNDKYLVKSEYATDLLANEICSGGGLWPVDIIPACEFMLVFQRVQADTVLSEASAGLAPWRRLQAQGGDVEEGHRRIG